MGHTYQNVSSAISISTLLVLKFEILPARQYFAGFSLRDFNKYKWKKGVQFRDLSLINLKQCVKSLQTNVMSQWKIQNGAYQ